MSKKVYFTIIITLNLKKLPIKWEMSCWFGRILYIMMYLLKISYVQHKKINIRIFMFKFNILRNL